MDRIPRMCVAHILALRTRGLWVKMQGTLRYTHYQFTKAFYWQVVRTETGSAYIMGAIPACSSETRGRFIHSGPLCTRNRIHHNTLTLFI